MATKYWAWTAEINSHTQSTLRLLAKRNFLQRRQFILRPQNQESQRTKLNKKKKQSAINTYYPRVCQTRKRHMTLGRRNLESRQLNWTHIHRVL